MNLSELLSQLAERTGYNADTLKEITGNAALASITLPDDFKSAVTSSLMTEKEAMINSTVKKHFTGSTLAGVESVLKDLIEEYHFDDDAKNVINSEQSTYARVKLFSKALAEIKDKQASAASGDKKKLVDDIQALNAQIVALKDEKNREVSATNETWLGKLRDRDLSAHFGKYDYAMDNVPVEIQAMTARQLVESKLREKGGKIKYDGESIQLVSASDDALPFTIDNKPVEWSHFTDSVVNEAKLIRVKGGQGAPNPNNPAPAPQPNKIVAPAAKIATSKALEDLRAGS